MSQLLLLRGATSLQDVATLLQFQAKSLAYIIYKKPVQSRYKSFQISKRSGGIRDIKWSWDGNRIYSAGIDGTCRVWDVATGKETARFDHGKGTRISSVGLTDHDQTLITSTDTGLRKVVALTAIAAKDRAR